MTSRRQFMGASFAALLQPAETNAKIRLARDAALAVLKPSPKDLEHALELHANSLVVESYGFSPRSAIDGERLREAICNTARDSFHLAQEHFLFGGLSPPNKK